MLNEIDIYHVGLEEQTHLEPLRRKNNILNLDNIIYDNEKIHNFIKLDKCVKSNIFEYQ